MSTVQPCENYITAQVYLPSIPIIVKYVSTAEYLAQKKEFLSTVVAKMNDVNAITNDADMRAQAITEVYRYFNQHFMSLFHQHEGEWMTYVAVMFNNTYDLELELSRMEIRYPILTAFRTEMLTVRKSMLLLIKQYCPYMSSNMHTSTAVARIIKMTSI